MIYTYNYTNAFFLLTVHFSEIKEKYIFREKKFGGPKNVIKN